LTAREARASGIVGITDGTSNTIAFAERDAQVSCADLDRDGTAGLFSVRSRSPTLAKVKESFIMVLRSPSTPDIDASSFYDTTIEIISADGRVVHEGVLHTLFVREARFPSLVLVPPSHAVSRASRSLWPVELILVGALYTVSVWVISDAQAREPGQ
jgi:hypothetical protein